MGQEETDFELIEPTGDNIFGKNSEHFSHEQLVQQAYMTVLKALSQEMTPGYWETKKDRLGNVLTYYVQDKRKAAIESIITLKNCMIFDIHLTTYQTTIKNLMTDADTEYATQLGKQKSWYEGLKFNDPRKEEYKVYVESECFNDKGIFYQNYILKKLDSYRKIFEQLEMCLGSRKYFKKSKATNLAIGDGVNG